MLFTPPFSDKLPNSTACKTIYGNSTSLPRLSPYSWRPQPPVTMWARFLMCDGLTTSVVSNVKQYHQPCIGSSSANLLSSTCQAGRAMPSWVLFETRGTSPHLGQLPREGPKAWRLPLFGVLLGLIGFFGASLQSLMHGLCAWPATDSALELDHIQHQQLLSTEQTRCKMAPCALQQGPAGLAPRGKIAQRVSTARRCHKQWR